MLTLTFALLAGCAQQKSVDELTARLTALEEKVATVEKARPAGAAAPADPAKEEAANAVMKEVTESLKTFDYATAKPKLEQLQKDYGDTKAGKAASRMYNEVAIVGTDAAPIEVESWFQGKGNYSDAPVTLMVFWEVWCPHCKKEMPELAEQEAELKKKGVQIVALTKVTKSSTDEKVTEFIKEHKLKYPVGKEKDGSLSKAFGVSGIPAAALVKNGKVIWRGHPGRLDEETLNKLIGS